MVDLGFCVLLFSLMLSSINCVIQFQCNTEHCLDQQVNYQCTVTGSVTLRWRIRDTNLTSLGTDSYNTGDDLSPFFPFGNAPHFSTDFSSKSPSLISNISFTVQSSINGYTILCEDQGGDNENCTINIADPPPSPTDVVLSFSQTTILISWTQPTFSSQCVSIANYTVSSNTTNTDITTTTTSVDLPLAGLSPTTAYCVSVAAVDTANRTGTYSDEECFVLYAPLPQTLTNQSFSRPSDNSTVIRISWTFVQTGRPLLTAVYLSYTVNGEVTLLKLPPTQTEFDIENVQRDTNYLITVFGENAVGNGSASSLTIIINSNEVLPPPPTTTTSTTMSTASVSPSNTPSNPPSDPPSNPSKDEPVPLVIIIIICIVVLVALAVLIIIIIAVIVYLKWKKKVQPENFQEHYAQLEMTSKSSQASSKMSSKGSAAMASTQSAPTEYSGIKHDIQYADIDVVKTSSSRSPPPVPSVSYSTPTFSGGKK